MAYILINIIVLVFVITTMLSMGLGLTTKQLKDTLTSYRLIGFGLVINVIIVPLGAWLLILLMPMPNDVLIGFLIIAMAPAAPFGPKLTQMAKGNIPLAVGLMFILAVVAVISVPITATIILGGGITIDALGILMTLVFYQLIPLLVGLLVNSLWGNVAEKLRKIAGLISNISLIAIIIVAPITYWTSLVGIFGSFGILTSLILIIFALIVGYLLGGPEKSTKRTMALSTIARNAAVASMVVISNFPTYDQAMIIVLVFSILYVIIGIFMGIFWKKHPIEEVT